MCFCCCSFAVQLLSFYILFCRFAILQLSSAAHTSICRYLVVCTYVLLLQRRYYLLLRHVHSTNAAVQPQCLPKATNKKNGMCACDGEGWCGAGWRRLSIGRSMPLYSGASCFQLAYPLPAPALAALLIFYYEYSVLLAFFFRFCLGC